MRAYVRRYVALLESRPLLTKARLPRTRRACALRPPHGPPRLPQGVTSAAVTGAGDLVCQCALEKREVRFALSPVARHAVATSACAAGGRLAPVRFVHQPRRPAGATPAQLRPHACRRPRCRCRWRRRCTSGTGLSFAGSRGRTRAPSPGDCVSTRRLVTPPSPPPRLPPHRHVSQGLFAPLFLPTFMAADLTLESHPNPRDKIRRDWWPALTTSWQIWVPAQARAAARAWPTRGLN